MQLVSSSQGLFQTPSMGAGTPGTTRSNLYALFLCLAEILFDGSIHSRDNQGYYFCRTKTCDLCPLSPTIGVFGTGRGGNSIEERCKLNHPALPSPRPNLHCVKLR